MRWFSWLLRRLSLLEARCARIPATLHALAHRLSRGATGPLQVAWAAYWHRSSSRRPQNERGKRLGRSGGMSGGLLRPCSSSALHALPTPPTMGNERPPDRPQPAARLTQPTPRRVPDPHMSWRACTGYERVLGCCVGRVSVAHAHTSLACFLEVRFRACLSVVRRNSVVTAHESRCSSYGEGCDRWRGSR